jgi:peptide/nickel transport system ATP-binding protein
MTASSRAAAIKAGTPGTPAAPVAVSVRGLTVRHDSRRPPVLAVDDVSLEVGAGETFAIIGESGSGKSTLLKTIAGLHQPSAGTVTIGSDASGPGGRVRAGRAQVVFQDADLALNPRQSVWKVIAEPLAPGRLRLPAALRAEVLPLLAEVGLSEGLADRRPHELSGGQRQRVTIARAMASGARLVLFDEPVSAQDVSLQASLLRLLNELQRQRQLTYLIVSHDVNAVAATADRVGVMYAARLVEVGDTAAVLSQPRHPYTQALIAAVPRIVADRAARPPRTLAGEPPDLRRPPAGCRFRARCPFAVDRCATEEPALRGTGGHQVACHRWEDIAAGTAGLVSTQSTTAAGAQPETERFTGESESERGGSQ